MKKTLLITTIIFCLAILSGCGGSEIDDMAYVVAIGIDEEVSGGYEFTFAIGNPGSINGGGGENAGSGDSNVLIFESQSGSSIFAAGDAVSARIGQLINFSHAELLVFSESVAADGVEIFLDGLTRNLSQRPKLVPTVAATTAKETLEAINSQFEGNPEKYLKKVFESDSSPVSTDIDSRDFFCQVKSTDSGSAVPRISATDGISVGSMSVFDGDHLVGAFDDILAYKLLCGMAEDMSYDMGDMGSLILAQRANPKISVVCGDVPQIYITVTLDATVASIDDATAKDQLYSAVEEALESRLYNLLSYSSGDVGIDIFGFDKYGRGSFLTWEEWQEYNWREGYKNAVFNLDVVLKAEKTGLIKGEL